MNRPPATEERGGWTATLSYGDEEDHDDGRRLVWVFRSST